MKTNTLLLIGAIAGSVIISSQLRPQKMSFYKEKENYVIDKGYIIKDVKKLSEADIATMLELQRTYKGKLTNGFILKTSVRNQINHGCFDIIIGDWRKYNDLRTKLDVIINKYRAQEIGKNYYSIPNNQIVTNAIMLKEKDIIAMDKLSVRGANEYSICPPDLRGKLAKRIVLTKTRDIGNIDPRINVKLNSILASYK